MRPGLVDAEQILASTTHVQAITGADFSKADQSKIFIHKYLITNHSNKWNSGTILEIGLRVGVIPLNGTPRYVMLTISLFEELYFCTKLC